MTSYADKFSKKKDLVIKAEVKAEVKVAPVVPKTGPWTRVGMTEADYNASILRLQQQEQRRQEDAKRIDEYNWNSPRFWKLRCKALENIRHGLNRKARWTATDAAEADYLDNETAFAEQRIEEIYNEIDRLENGYD
jgi:hypothetical protein